MADAFAPARVRAALEASWSLESSSRWSRDNPAIGQCNPTALLVYERFGGKIFKTRVGDEWHFYNRIDGLTYDFTAAQFSTPVSYDGVPASPTEALTGTCADQVRALARRFEAAYSAS